MKLRPYKEIITMAKEKVEESLAPIRAKQMKKKGELEKAKIEERIITLESKIQEACSKHPVDFDEVIRQLDELALAERKLKQFDKILAEMFPGEED